MLSKAVGMNVVEICPGEGSIEQRVASCSRPGSKRRRAREMASDPCP